MTASSPHPRFALRSRAWTMGAPDCERLIERPACRRKLKLRGRSTLLDLSAAGRARPGNRQDDRTRQDRSALPKCRPSANVRNAAMPTWPSFWLRRPKIRALAAMAGRSPVRAVAPVAWLDSYGRRRHVGPWSQEFSPAGFPRKRGPRPAFLAHAPAAPKFVAPAGAQRCACPPLASGGSGSVSSSRP